jgi:membrane-associated phospholipid phosphatase
VFSAITWCGDGPLYFLLFPILYWAKSPGIAVRYGYLWGASLLVMTVLKEHFGTPRPFVVAPEWVACFKYPLEGLYRFASHEALLAAYRQSPAFPSGHALFSAALGMYLHAQTAARGVRWLLRFFVVMIPLSRVYLGVHYPVDVLAGSGVGLLLCCGATRDWWGAIGQGLSRLGLRRWQRPALLGVLLGGVLALLSKHAVLIWVILLSYPLLLTLGAQPIRVLAAEHEVDRWRSQMVWGCVGVGMLLWATTPLRSLGTLLSVPLVTGWVTLGCPLLVKTISMQTKR